MPVWVNPYSDLQKQFRDELNAVLRRNNGIVKRVDAVNCFETDDQQKVEKALNRIFLSRADGNLEWKPEFTEASTLEKRIAI